ncbi:DUF2155 domain-containing protein [Altererythrobacter aquiaggeris]|uniref:DUF2155 domain-containing protein n=1 Tax=Aestuarierythrobacter aquiaggeris TaxID=1898396 RepID=UPI003018ABBE
MRAAIAILPLLALAACSGEPDRSAQPDQEVPEELKQGSAAAVDPVQVEGATPLADRVATIGLLNKRNNLSQDIEMKPGESRRIENVVIRLASCERTAPWELPKQTGAFLQVLVEERENAGDDLEWRKIFSGWLFKEAPSLNVVEHPIYDVWVKDCAMSFPGEEAPAEESSEESSEE